MIPKILERLRRRTPASEIDFEGSGGPSTMPTSLLPIETDEVREFNRALISNVREILEKFDLAIVDAELRRRLSARTYRLYLTTSTRTPLEKLTVVEAILRPAIHKANQIELAEIFWRYQEHKG